MPESESKSEREDRGRKRGERKRERRQADRQRRFGRCQFLMNSNTYMYPHYRPSFSFSIS